MSSKRRVNAAGAPGSQAQRSQSTEPQEQPKPFALSELPQLGPDSAEQQRRRAVYRRAVDECSDSLLDEFAFPALQWMHSVPGLLASNPADLALSRITKAEMLEALTRIRAGVSPRTAICRVTGISSVTYNEYWKRGLDPDERDTRFSQFRVLISQSVAFARASAEGFVFVDNPLAWLTRGPGGRSSEGDPGWTDEPPPPTQVQDTSKPQIIANILVLLNKVSPVLLEGAGVKADG